MLTKTEDKKKSKRVSQTPKKCLWCEEIIEIGRRSPARYNKIKTHAKCVVSYVHHRCSCKDFKVISDRGEVRCESCEKLLVRKENETLQSWEKRRFCDKSCAAKDNDGRRKINTPVITKEQMYHVKIYKPGTPEFNAVAALYL